MSTEPDELMQWLTRPADQGGGNYLACKKLSDGTIAAIGDLLYTRAIYLNVTRDSWDRRFCFDDRALAVAEFERIDAGDEPEGWIAQRP